MTEQRGEIPNNSREEQPNPDLPELRTNGNRWRNKRADLGLTVVVLACMGLAIAGLASGRIDPHGPNDACNIRGGIFKSRP